MLPVKNRLTKDKDFNYIFKNGKPSYNKITGFKVVKNQLQLNRFGIIIGKKINNKAIKRNTIKRQIRAIIQSKDLCQPNISQGYDCLIITLPKIDTANYAEIKQSIENHLIKLKIY